MQPTTNQSVPTTPCLPSQAADRQPGIPGQAPAPLPEELLKLVGGGKGPVNLW
jgi:hypothetical protein